MPTCAAGHTLSRWRNRAPNLVCDGSCDQGPIAIRAWRWSCSLCDYDICEECANLLILCEVKHPKEGPTPSMSKQVSAESSSPVACATCDDDGAAKPVPQPTAPPSAHAPPGGAAGTPDLGGKALSGSPAVGTGHEPSGPYVAPPGVLDSIRKDLSFRPSDNKPAKQSALRPAAPTAQDIAMAEALGLREGLRLAVHEPQSPLAALPEPGAGEAAPHLLPTAGVLDLSACGSLGLPPAEAARMQARRD
eukprot:7382555-Prymnesium_polylepis.1